MFRLILEEVLSTEAKKMKRFMLKKFHPDVSTINDNEAIIRRITAADTDQKVFDLYDELILNKKPRKKKNYNQKPKEEKPKEEKPKEEKPKEEKPKPSKEKWEGRFNSKEEMERHFERIRKKRKRKGMRAKKEQLK